MTRPNAVLVAIVLGFNAIGAAEPVVAPRPMVPACLECRFTPRPSRDSSIDGPRMPAAGQSPQPLPLPDDAVPLASDGNDPTIATLVDKHLGHLPPVERRIWIDELQGLPPEAVRELLLARDRAGGEEALDPLRKFQVFEPPVQSEPPSPDSSSSKRPSFARSIALLREAETVILNNIANAETVGFKRVVPLTAGDVAKSGIAELTTRRIATQGRIRETGRPLDWALEGDGMFQVERDGIVGLTRRGLFNVNDEGLLTTAFDGRQWTLRPQIRVPAEATGIRIDKDGKIFCRVADDVPARTLGRIMLVRVNDLTRLDSIAGGLWRMPEDQILIRTGLAGEAGFAEIRSGFLEGSNVDLAEEIAALEHTRRQIAILDGREPGRLAGDLQDSPASQ